MTGERKSLRKAYGEALVELGKINSKIIALEADLGKSTMSNMFQQAFPDRYFEMGIAEQDMISTAGGLAASGFIPFASTFAVFATGRAYDQIRQTIAIGKLNVKICGSSSGLSDIGDGATHQAIEDIALMNALPNMTILTPADANETKAAVYAAADSNGPVYIRISRSNLPIITNENRKFEIGKMSMLTEGNDIAIFSHGVMLEKCLNAYEELKREGISARVINVSTIKPFDYDYAIKTAEEVKAILSVEDHTYSGGLSSILALALRKEKTPMDYISIEDTFGQSATNEEELLSCYGLTKENIIKKAKILIKMATDQYK